jgi:uncharacterized repeat protein (TIGR03803 family)
MWPKTCFTARERMRKIGILLFAGALGCAQIQPVQAADGARFNEKLVWSFGAGTDGQYPAAGLVNMNGVLFGTTALGGTKGKGVVFSINPKTGAETVLHSFCTKRHRYCLDGATPLAALIEVKGKLAGTTDGGGATARGGAVFLLNPVTRKEKLLYSFCQDFHCTDGYFPTASLVEAGGAIYGTTDEGGDNQFGVAFAVDLKTGIERRLHSFCSLPNCTDGRNSGSGLIVVSGLLYGTTVAGGADYTGCDNAGCGAVYAIDPKTGEETVIYSFHGRPDGDGPEGNLLFANGLLYGVTESGGRGSCLGGDGCGAVFAVDPATGGETVLYSFCGKENCADGALPLAGLIAANGMLYGTTISGGDYGRGTVFSVDPATGEEAALYSFCRKRNCVDGAEPLGSLIDVDSVLYGATQDGGAYDKGTVFALIPQ